MITEQNWADAEILWDYLQMHQEPRPCSVGIALGSHDLGVADVAADLYHRDMFPLLVVTGANSPTTKDRMPRGEAVHYRERVLELGVPPEKVLVEPRARNTGENIEFSRALLQEAHVKVASVLLVSKPYEERRAYATARKLWDSVNFLSISASLTLSEYVSTIQDAKLVIDMMVGAAQRIKNYPDRGLMIRQKVPDEVSIAYERLVAASFTNRMAASVKR
ncbi:YdcF family protein [Streptomyces sp. HPF1205]|uniref:YdcF family protein n=1 Tax=Streptomyces sp. HPF1205 TaxID=2873262 RepID=UPI001CEC558A|nr:YdcF family protein [Streptomyces sp. HPF1205]